MRRVVLKLTEAQASFLRGAVRLYVDEMGMNNMLTKVEEKWSDEILQQLSQPAREAA